MHDFGKIQLAIEQYARNHDLVDPVKIQEGTNAIYRSGDLCLRVLVYMTQAQLANAHLSEKIAEDVHRIDPSLTVGFKKRDKLLGYEFQIWEWRESRAPTKEEYIDAVKRWQKINPSLSKIGLDKWAGPMRSLPKYLEVIRDCDRLDPAMRHELEARYMTLREIEKDLLASGDYYVMHSDLNPGNVRTCLETGKAFLVDWDCITTGPHWGDWLKGLRLGIDPKECMEDPTQQEAIKTGAELSDLASVSFALWRDITHDNDLPLDMWQSYKSKYIE